MDLNHLAVFVRVVEAQSFTAAATALGLPKSTVSRRIAQLEEDLGVRLLQRTTRKLSMTDAGHAYFARAVRALSEIDEATLEVRDMQGKPRGTVRMSAPVDLAVDTLTGVVARFVRKQPGIRIEVSLSARKVDLVAEGFDLALRAGSVGDQTLIARKIGTMPSRLYAATQYLRRKGTPTRVAELAEHDCVLFRPKDGKSVWRLEGPKGVEAVEVTGPVSADEFAFVRSAVLEGLGIGLLPWLICAREVDRGKLAPVLPEHASAGGPLHLVYPSARHVPQRVALFRDFLLRELGELPWAR